MKDVYNRVPQEQKSAAYGVFDAVSRWAGRSVLRATKVEPGLEAWRKATYEDGLTGGERRGRVVRATLSGVAFPVATVINQSRFGERFVVGGLATGLAAAMDIAGDFHGIVFPFLGFFTTPAYHAIAPAVAEAIFHNKRKYTKDLPEGTYFNFFDLLKKNQ